MVRVHVISFKQKKILNLQGTLSLKKSPYIRWWIYCSNIKGNGCFLKMNSDLSLLMIERNVSNRSNIQDHSTCAHLFLNNHLIKLPSVFCRVWSNATSPGSSSSTTSSTRSTSTCGTTRNNMDSALKQWCFINFTILSERGDKRTRILFQIDLFNAKITYRSLK